MYGVVNGLQGGAQLPKPRFRQKKQGKAIKDEAPKPCCQAFGEGLRRFFLRLRAAILILVLSLGMPGFYLTHHFLLKPNLVALKAQLEPGTCEVAVSKVLKGIKNCTWSSCRQGCTVEEMYTCWQVLIVSHRGSSNFSKMTHNNSVKEKEDYPVPQALIAIPLEEPDYYTDKVMDTHEYGVSNTSIETNFHKNKTTEMVLDTESSMNVSRNHTELVRLKINVGGCGYSSCIDWWNVYGQLGTTFPCYIGDDGQIAVPDFDAQQARTKLVLGVLPLILTAVALLLMYRLYWRKGHTDNTLSLSSSREIREAKMEQVRAQLLLQIAKEVEPKPRAKTKNIWSFTLKSKRLAKVKPYGNESDMENENAQKIEDNEDANNVEVKVHNDDSRPNPAEQWLKVAIWAATRHPCISSARKFTEVEFDKIDES